ncbi:MAG TPA: IS66 family insertion sequence element accessory protein TnpB [Candidatus Angelobacter sp.]
MFGLGPATRIYVATGATDMRKGYEGLYGLVRDRLLCEARSGHVFLFCNGQRNRVKVLLWDGSGLWVCAKRLEKGRFHWPEAKAEENKVVLSHEELSLLLNGLDLQQVKGRRNWYREVTRGEPFEISASL